MDNNELFLIYINNFGVDFEGDNVLEFIFSDVKKDVDGEDWDSIPASSKPQPPYDKFIKKVGVLKTDIDFEFIQDSTCYAVWDSMDGVVALAYESLADYTEYPDNRMVFHFGITLNDTEKILYERDLTLTYKK